MNVRNNIRLARIVHKNVRSKDMQDIGNVAAVDNNSIIIEQHIKKLASRNTGLELTCSCQYK